MKKIMYLLLILGLFIAACQPPKEPTDGGMQAYENKEFGFKMSYPDSWTKQETGETQPIIILIAPKTDEEGTDGFSVGISDIPEGSKIDEFKDAVLQDIQSQVPDVKINTEQTTLGGLPAYKIEYSVSTGQLVQAFTIKDQTVYIVSGITYVDQYEQKKPLFNSIFDSFQFI